MVSGAVVQHLREGDFVLRALGRYAPKGAAIPIECFDVMGEARDAAVTGSLQEELESSARAADLAHLGKLAEAIAALNQALQLAKGTHRETGYRLRLTALEAGDTVVRLSEK